MQAYQKLTCQRLLAWLLGFGTYLTAVGTYPIADSLITDNTTCLSLSKSTHQLIINQSVYRFLDVVLFLVIFCLVAFGLVSPHLRDCH